MFCDIRFMYGTVIYPIVNLMQGEPWQRTASGVYRGLVTKAGCVVQIRSVELSEWHTAAGARVYRDWAPAHAHDHPPACARMPIASHNIYNGNAHTTCFMRFPSTAFYRTYTTP